MDHDVEEVVRMFAAPGDFWALSSGDPSPVNCMVANGAVRFFDFEYAHFRHSFLDANMLRYLYPTGGPVWNLPPDVAEAIQSAYREQLARAYPDVLDESGIAGANAAWTILRMTRLPKVEAGPDRNSWPLLPPDWSAPIPTRSRRRQLVAIIETFIVSARRAGRFETLAAWCESLIGELRERWKEATEEIPLYPAFR